MASPLPTPDEELELPPSPPFAGDGPSSPEVMSEGNGTTDVLKRWRVPIAITLSLALSQRVGMALGPLWGWITLAALAVGPLIYYGSAWTGKGLRQASLALFVFVVGSLGLSQIMPPVAAAGVAFAAALVLTVQVLRFSLRHLMILVLVAAVLIRVGLTFGSAAPALLLVLAAPLILVTVFMVFFRQRSYEQDALVEALALAARSGKPLGPAAEAFASLCSPGFRRHATRLADRLNQGIPLDQALQADRRVATSETRLFAAVGSKWSLLDRSLGSAVDASRTHHLDQISIQNAIAYPLVLCGLIATVAHFILYFIIPKIRMIALDFGIPPSDPSMLPLQWVSGYGRSFWISGLVGLVLSLSPLFMLASLFILGLNMLGLRVFSSGGWLNRKRESAAVVRALALGIEQSRPLPEMMHDLAKAAPTAWLRKNLNKVRTDVVSGRPWPKSLQKRGIVKSGDRAVLEAAERAGNLPWAAQEVAVLIEKRAKLRIRLLSTWLQPVLLVAVGSLVLFVALTYFLPILSLMQRLAEDAS